MRTPNVYGSSAPGVSFKDVTPDDDTDLPDGPCRSLWVGTGGDVEIIGALDSTATVIKNVQDGSTLSFAVKRVRAAATTAGDIVAIY